MRRFWNGLWITISAAVVVAVVFPFLTHASIDPKKPVCMSNLKQLSICLIEYSGDSDGKLPPRDLWMDLAEPYARETSIEHCTQVDGPGLYGYAFNAGIKNSGRSLEYPGGTPMIYDSINLARNASDRFTSLPVPGRHEGRNFVGFADGHAKSIGGAR